MHNKVLIVWSFDCVMLPGSVWKLVCLNISSCYAVLVYPEYLPRIEQTQAHAMMEYWCEIRMVSWWGRLAPKKHRLDSDCFYELACKRMLMLLLPEARLSSCCAVLPSYRRIGSFWNTIYSKLDLCQLYCVWMNLCRRWLCFGWCIGCQTENNWFF